MVNRFEENGVRVLLPYLPWDQGTRNTGQSDVVSLIDVIIRSNCSGKLLTFQIRCPKLVGLLPKINMLKQNLIPCK